MVLPMEEITQDLERITDRHVKRLGQTLAAIGVGEEVLGVASPRVQRLWGLALEYTRKSELFAHACKYDIEGAADKQVAENAAVRYESLSKVVRAVAWIETHDALGARSWAADLTGIRAGYTVVKCASAEVVSAELLSSFPIASQEHLEHIKRTIKLMFESKDAPSLEEALEKKGKVQ